MRPSQPPPSLLSLLLVLLSNTHLTSATPFLNSELHNVDYSFLQGRDCALYCGLGGRYCCEAGQGCFTDAQSIAYCSSTVGNAVVATGYAVYTTTWTQTGLVTRTSTYSSWFQQAAVPTTQNWVPVNTAGPAICTLSGETSCGAICCAGNQYCASSGQCSAVASSWTYVVPVVTTSTSTYIAPLRPTSGVVVTATATTTQPFLAPATASGTTLPVTVVSGNKLSGGEIAGIVIGVLAAILLLLLLCFFCIAKAGIDGLLGLFGGRRRRRDRVVTEETVERYSRHGSGTGSRRDTHGAWYAAGGRRPATVVETRKKKSSGMGGLGAVGAGLLGLAVVLGLKRKHDRNEKSARSHVSSSYGSYTTTESSQSSASSDRRTRDSRRH